MGGFMSRVIYRGATEYISSPVVSNVTLSAQPVHFSFDDRATWTAATWIGSSVQDPQTLLWTRTAQLQVVASTMFPAAGMFTLLVRVTDNPEIPIMNAGGITVR
jgi:hypothetical protein